jgi:hypothetical protein
MSGPWEQFAAPAPSGPWSRFAAPDVKPQEQTEALGTSVGQGATFGFGDELTAAARAALPGFSNFMMRTPESAFGATPDAQGHVQPIAGGQNQTVSTAPTFGERYDAELAKARAQNKANEQAYPVTTTAGNIAGNLATTVLAAPEAALSLGPSVLRNAAKYAGVSGLIGGIQGFGDGEGGFANRTINAVANAVPAAVVGGLVPVAGRVGRAIAESTPGRVIGDYLARPLTRALTGATTETVPATNAESGAVQRIATALQRSGLTPQDISQKLTNIGPDAVLADVDPQFFSQARMAHTMPGETRSLAENVLESRDARLPAYLRAGFTGDTPPPSTFALAGNGQAFDQNLRAVGQRAYGEMNAAGLKQTPALIEIENNPIVSKAIDNVMNVERQTRIGTNRPPSSPVEIMHKVKQAIWDMGFDAATARPGPNASYYRDLGTEYMNRLKQANPALAAADKAYGEAASLPEHFQAGYDFLANGGTGDRALNASSQGLADRLATATPQQSAAVQAGMTNRAVDLTNGRNALGNTRSLARDIKFGGDIQNRLEQGYGTDQAADILRRAEGVRQMTKTSQGILGNSSTAARLAEAGLDTGNLGVRITDNGITPGFRETLKNIVGHVVNPNEAIRNAIGKAMLNPDSKENARILALADALMKQRAAGAPIRAALPGAVSNQFIQVQ